MECMWGLPHSPWHFADFPSGTWGPSCLAMAQKWKGTFISSTTNTAGFTPDLCSLCLSLSPPFTDSSAVICYSSLIVYLFQIHPSVSALIAGRRAVDYFIFATQGYRQIKLSPFFHLQTDGCYTSTNMYFIGFKWLIKVYFCCILSRGKTDCHYLVHQLIASFTWPWSWYIYINSQCPSVHLTLPKLLLRTVALECLQLRLCLCHDRHVAAELSLRGIPGSLKHKAYLQRENSGSTRYALDGCGEEG